jgi:hypothetical protein
VNDDPNVIIPPPMQGPAPNPAPGAVPEVIDGVEVPPRPQQRHHEPPPQHRTPSGPPPIPENHIDAQLNMPADSAFDALPFNASVLEPYIDAATMEVRAVVIACWQLLSHLPRCCVA